MEKVEKKTGRIKSESYTSRVGQYRCWGKNVFVFFFFERIGGGGPCPLHVNGTARVKAREDSIICGSSSPLN